MKDALRLDALDNLEVARIADRALATLHARVDGADTFELSDAIDGACDAWDRFADLLPDFRVEAPRSSDTFDGDCSS